MSACKGAAGSRYYSIVDLTHPPHACIRRRDRGPDHNTENFVLLFCEWCVGSSMSHSVIYEQGL